MPKPKEKLINVHTIYAIKFYLNVNTIRRSIWCEFENVLENYCLLKIVATIDKANASIYNIQRKIDESECQTKEKQQYDKGPNK